MKTALDRDKYKRRMITLWAVMIMLGLAAIFVVIMNLLINNGLSYERIFVVIGLLLLFSFFAYLTKFYYLLRKLENVIVYENGLLNDFSKPFNKAVDLKIENVISISFWSSNRGINQYKIVTKNHNPQQKGLMNQLKGNHIYLTDYIVDSQELNKLALLIESECA